MQFSKLAFIAAIASSVTAQTVSISDLPTCALAPAVSAIGTTGCGTDIGCVCKNSGFLTSLTPQIQAACSAADFQKAVSVAYQLCLENGVTITTTIPAATSAPAPVSSASSAPSVTATSTGAVATSSGPVATSSGSVATSSAPVVTSTLTSLSSVVTSVTTVPKNGTVTSALPSVVTANAAAVHGTWAAAGLLGVGALLAAL